MLLRKGSLSYDVGQWARALTLQYALTSPMIQVDAVLGVYAQPEWLT